MTVIACGYGIFALSLIFQGERWGRTPAYRNLLAIMPQSAWGACFAVVAALLAAALARRRWRWLSVTALTAAFMLTTGWGLAFVVRWATSDSTTPETWVSWACFDYLILRAIILLDFEEVRVPRAGQDVRARDA